MHESDQSEIDASKKTLISGKMEKDISLKTAMLMEFMNSLLSPEEKREFLESALASLKLDPEGTQTQDLITRSHLFAENYAKLLQNYKNALKEVSPLAIDTKVLLSKKCSKTDLLFRLKEEYNFRNLCFRSLTSYPSTKPLLFPETYIWTKFWQPVFEPQTNVENVQIHPCLRSWDGRKPMTFYASSPVACYLDGHLIVQSNGYLEITEPDFERHNETDQVFYSLVSSNGTVFGSSKNGIYRLKGLLEGKFECIQVYDVADCYHLFIHDNRIFWINDDRVWAAPLSFVSVTNPREIQSAPNKSSEKILPLTILKARMKSKTLKASRLCDEAMDLGENLGGFCVKEDGELLGYMSKDGRLVMPLVQKDLKIESVMGMTVGANGELAVISKQDNGGYMITSYI